MAVDPALLARLAELDGGQVLLLQPLELRARAMLLESALGLQSDQEVLEVALEFPTLMTQ